MNLQELVFNLSNLPDQGAELNEDIEKLKKLMPSIFGNGEVQKEVGGIYGTGYATTDVDAFLALPFVTPSVFAEFENLSASSINVMKTMRTKQYVFEEKRKAMSIPTFTKIAIRIPRIQNLNSQEDDYV